MRTGGANILEDSLEAAPLAVYLASFKVATQLLSASARGTYGCTGRRNLFGNLRGNSASKLAASRNLVEPPVDPAVDARIRHIVGDLFQLRVVQRDHTVAGSDPGGGTVLLIVMS